MKVKKQIKKFLPLTLFRVYHFLLSWLGAMVYRFPSRQMIIIGVTGTSGKSTVVELIYQILQSTHDSIASLSSIKSHLGNQSWENQLKMTMPGRFYLQRFLARARSQKCRYVILEVTSEGILQSRHRFIDFDILVFTNLSPEHIEHHGGFENYQKTKGKLFAILSKTKLVKKHKRIKKTIIANLDDKYAPYFLSFPADRKIGYGLNDSMKNLEIIKAENIVLQSDNSKFNVANNPFQIFLPGQFNISNALAALAVGYSQGISFLEMSRALRRVKSMPGRLELVVNDSFRVFVDYAHTPVALEKVYQTLKRSLKGKMICLLGSCGGGRDKWKRPVLGKIASQYCQKIIITNEDPYSENPQEIIEQVKSGVDKKFPIKDLFIVLDREKAIDQALRLAKPNDVVVLTGKGSESVMCVAEGKIPWSDKEKVLQAMKKITDL